MHSSLTTYSSSSACEEASQALVSSKCKTSDQILAIFGPKNPYILYIWLSMALVWALAAMPMMCSAFLMDEGCMKNKSSSDHHQCIPMNGTITAEFHLNASQGILVDMTTSAMLAGMSVGSIIMPLFTDLLGRRPILLAVLLLGGGGGCLSALSPNIYVFIALRFVQGLSFSGTSLTNWVLAYESIPIELRSKTALSFGLMWVIGYCLIAPMAFYLPNWRHLIIAVSAPSLFFAVFYFFTIPESLHYLVSKRKAVDVAQWLKMANKYANCAKLNGVDQHDVQQFIAHIQQEKCQKIDQNNKITMVQQERDSSLLEKLRANRLLLKFVTVFIVLWTCDALIYYGLSLFSTKLAGDRYINFSLMGLVEVPSYVFSPWLLDKMGRRPFTAFTHFLGAFAFLLTVFASDMPFLVLLLWLLAKFVVASSFTGLFVYASEVFPTVHRSICMGICTTVSQLGCTILAPAIRIMSDISPIVPMIFFGSCSLIAALITYTLPETKGKELPDRTFERTDL